MQLHCLKISRLPNQKNILVYIVLSYHANALFYENLEVVKMEVDEVVQALCSGTERSSLQTFYVLWMPLFDFLNTFHQHDSARKCARECVALNPLALDILEKHFHVRKGD